ncbi:hypothetical protein GCM10009850_072390 [Nonomuraea monospora]|uniref:HTH cro/C1-type domain-containing protein n=1 Tax=Nonomuraea monospora TaxID=568818 RepID=A0ABP5PJS5_9ACTN
MGRIDLRAEVREFLSSRRARITPQQAGLPAYGGNRRVKGLRREEVAMLAGVSIDYYVRMERGNLAGASDSVLDALARALQLDEAEHEHLFALARASGPSARHAGAPPPGPGAPRDDTPGTGSGARRDGTPGTGSGARRDGTPPTDSGARRDNAPPAGSGARRGRRSPTGVGPAVQQVLDAITDAPAWVRNGRHDILATNRLARALYAPILATPRHPPNTTRFLYLDETAPEFFVDWDRIACDAAAMLRLEAGRNPYDPDLIELVGELSTRSGVFRQRWASHDVRFHRSGRKRLRHPVVGRLDLDFESMELTSEPGLILNVYTAATGTPAADGLRMLASWAATQDLNAPDGR